MSGQGRLGGDPGGFAVSNFADQNNVGVLPQDPAQESGKGQINTMIHLVLGNRRQADLHRVFQGSDVDVWFVELGQARIERSGFTTTCRAADEDDSVGALDGALDGAADRVGETDG